MRATVRAPELIFIFFPGKEVQSGVEQESDLSTGNDSKHSE